MSTLTPTVSNSTSTPWITVSGSGTSKYITTSNIIVNNITSGTTLGSGTIIYNDGYISTTSIEDLVRSYGIDVVNQKINVKHGWSLETPDGTIINVDNNGNIEIKDDNAKIVYKANRIREFNRFLNASDLLEDFIRFIGSKGVKQDEVLNIPIEVFINWLIIEAAVVDGEEPPMLPLNNKEYPRCLTCGKFIKKSLAQVAKFCNPDHYSKYLLKNFSKSCTDLGSGSVTL